MRMNATVAVWCACCRERRLRSTRKDARGALCDQCSKGRGIYPRPFSMIDAAEPDIVFLEDLLLAA